VAAVGVGEAGDPGGDLQAGFGPRGGAMPVGVIDLEGGVERFGGGVESLNRRE
jgi:hypothetical protein